MNNDLVVRLQKGENAAYQELVDDFHNRVYNTCLGFVHNSPDAEDLAQEVFLEVFRSINRFEERSSLSTWVYRIAVTKSLELLRKRKRKKRAGKILSLFGLQEAGWEIPDETYHHPGVELENKERAEHLFKAIESLPLNQKIAFTLHKIDGKPYQKVAEIMHVSLSSVESLMFRARRNLQKKLKNYYKGKI